MNRMHARAKVSENHTVRSTLRFLEELTSGYRKTNFRVRLWDGTEWGDRSRPTFTLVLKHPGAIRKMFTPPSELTLGEAFVYGDFDIEGDLESSLGLADFLLLRDHSVIDDLHLDGWLDVLPTTGPDDNHNQTAEIAEMNPPLLPRQQYLATLPDDFYSLCLGDSMIDSLGYFESFQTEVAKAQQQGMAYICKKLRLRRGDRILNLECGWGGLMTFMAENYGIHVRGITSSISQSEFARNRFRFAGVTNCCMIDVGDYRDLDPPQPFDKIVSGAFTSIAEPSLPDYYQHVLRMLRPGGVFLTYCVSPPPFLPKEPGLVDKYTIHPCEPIPLVAAVRAAESVGFEVRDVENVREHCALTLRHWSHRLEDRSKEARQFVGDLIYRAWRLYLAGVAHHFLAGHAQIYQVLFSKPDCGSSRLPLTREDWYA